MTNEPGVLAIGEAHPAARFAAMYLRHLGTENLLAWQEAFASNAIENNRLAEVCAETMHRFLIGEPVSDRYLLGMAFVILSGDPGDD